MSIAEIEVKYESVMEANNSILTERTNINETAKIMGQDTENLADSWQGKDYDAFKNEMDKILADINRETTAIRDAVVKIDASAESHKEADRKSASVAATLPTIGGGGSGGGGYGGNTASIY